MTKKIVFVGPQEVGKSTIRKWLFEGESLFKLLENPMEPTYGFENYSYNLLQNLGVFDLAGQENERWFSEEKTIFNDSDIILNVLDSRHAITIITDYIKKAIKLQTAQSKNAKIFFLIHKIDLIDPVQLAKLESKLKSLAEELKGANNGKLNYYFTSIKEDYLYSTINSFIDIFRQADFDTEGELDTKLIKLNSDLFHILHTQKVLSLERLMVVLETSKASLQSLMASYENAGFLSSKITNGQNLIYLTEKGEKYYEQVLKSFRDLSDEFSPPSIIKEIKDQPLEIKIKAENMIYGIMISDSNGKTLIVVETKGNSLMDALNRANNPQFDLELIPMFLNAMSKFAEEINVQDLSSFRVQGGNLKMSSLSRKTLTLTIFTHPDLHTDLVKEDISQMFDKFFEDYDSYLAPFFKTGNATKFLDFVPDAVNIIFEIVSKYVKLQSNISPFDGSEAKKIYKQLNEVDEKNYSLEEQLQIKSLKVKMLETIIAEDAEAFSLLRNEINSFI